MIAASQRSLGAHFPEKYVWLHQHMSPDSYLCFACSIKLFLSKVSWIFRCTYIFIYLSVGALLSTASSWFCSAQSDPWADTWACIPKFYHPKACCLDKPIRFACIDGRQYLQYLFQTCVDFCSNTICFVFCLKTSR